MTAGEAAYTQFVIEYPGPRPSDNTPSWERLSEFEKEKWERIGMSNNAKLRPCPFCGSSGLDLIIHHSDMVTCNCCKVDALSIENWNTRPIEAQLRRLLAECKEHIDFWMSALPPTEKDYNKMEIATRQLQNQIEEALE